MDELTISSERDFLALERYLARAMRAAERAARAGDVARREEALRLARLIMARQSEFTIAEEPIAGRTIVRH